MLIPYTYADYVGAILGLARDQSDWRLDPLTVRILPHMLLFRISRRWCAAHPRS
jgi:hypothetical protein